jgi:ABC-type glycerol-3-phosphate transport system substrate-binding protein
MKNMTTFQIAVIGIFVALAIVGVLIFAGVGGLGDDDQKIGNVEIWGTVSHQIIDKMISELNTGNGRFADVDYIEKDKETYEEEFVEALAAGSGPDLFLLEQDGIIRNQDKIIEIPYDTIPERDFKNTFIEEGEMYLTENGVLGLPFTIDPMVMYWNRDIFQSVGIANPPEFWDELFVLSPKITQRDTASNITRSFTALGEFTNVENAKEILSAFIIQSGNRIVVPIVNGFESIINEKLDFATPPAEAAVRFYTEFSNPIKSVYSWNKSLPNSKQLFTAGDLAIYFGFASELSEILRSNPNLNLNINPLPQLRDANTKVTYGKMSAFAIPKNSKNQAGALSTGLALTSLENIARFSVDLGLPPVRRDALIDKPTDAIGSVFYDSALMSKSWFDPDSDETDDIFKNMVESVTSGRALLGEAVNLADRELDLLLRSR